jgi:hypothetical protein
VHSCTTCHSAESDRAACDNAAVDIKRNLIKCVAVLMVTMRPQF